LQAAANHIDVVAGKLAAREQADVAKPVNAHAVAQPQVITVAPTPSSPIITASPAISDAPPHTSINKIKLSIGIGIYAILLIYSLISGAHFVTWLALLSMNVFGTVAFNLLLKRSEWKKVDPWFTAAVMQTGMAIPFIVKEIVNPIHFTHYSPFSLLLMGYCVFALITLQICNVESLKYLEASVFSVVFNSRIVLATFFGAFFLSEEIGIWALMGGLLIFAAIFVIKQKTTRSVAKIGVLYGLGAAFAMSSMNTCEKELIQTVGYLHYIVPVWTAAAVLMWGIVLVRKTNAPYNLIVKPQGLTIMAVRAFAAIGFTSALIFGPVAVSSYISSLSVVFVVLFGMLILNEWDYVKSKIQATILSILGLTFILIDGFH
jgi:drug/metabolite transporter (DMT)-like permease